MLTPPPVEPTTRIDLFYPSPTGMSPERVRLLHQMEMSLLAKPEFRHISLLNPPLFVQVPIEPAPIQPVAHEGPAARKRRRRAELARHEQQLLAARQSSTAH